MTFDYAQTNLQLVRQMRALNYLEADIARVERTYQTAIPMFFGPVPWIRKAIYFPPYRHSKHTRFAPLSRGYDFGGTDARCLHTGRLRFSFRSKRLAQTKPMLKPTISVGRRKSWVYLYARLDWKAHHIHTYVEDWHRLPVEKKTTIRIRLANEREDFLDNGMIAERNTKADQIAKLGMQANILTLAERADWPELASDLKNEFEQFNKALLNLESADSSGFFSFLSTTTRQETIASQAGKSPGSSHAKKTLCMNMQ